MNSILDESVKKNAKIVTDKKLRGYMPKYKTYFSALHESVLAKYRPISDLDMVRLGDSFENFNAVQRIFESAGSVSTLGALPLIKYDLLTYQYATNPLTLAASVQEVDEPIGSIYYKAVYSSIAKGNVEANQRIAGGAKSPNFIKDFTTNGNKRISLVTTTATEYEFNGQTKCLPNSIKIVSEHEINGVKVFGQDDGSGHIIGYGVEGTVDYETCRIDVGLSGTVEAGCKLEVIYTHNVEASGKSGKVYLGLVPHRVECEPITLASEFGIFQDFAVYKKFGSSADDDLIVDLSNLINFELCNRFCQSAIDQVPTENQFSWVRNKSEYVTYGQQVPEIYRKLGQMDGAILQAAGRGSANVLIVGTNAAADFEGLEGFESIETDGVGAKLKGKIRNRAVIVNPGQDKDKVVGLYKGQSGFDGAGYQANYMPLTISDLLPGQGGNNFKRERVAATWATAGIAVPAFVASLDMIETPESST